MSRILSIPRTTSSATRIQKVASKFRSIFLKSPVGITSGGYQITNKEITVKRKKRMHLKHGVGVDMLIAAWSITDSIKAERVR